ncbi:MAG: FKBP-type peptidyl-prolyl cis-trans isomerase [Arenicella sp.]|jgi:FKBP-type peptidyl-prolyl cis-trans isomerase
MSLTKSILLAAGIAVIAAGTYFATVSTPENIAQAADTKELDLSTDAAKLGYTFGAQIATDMKRQNLQDDIGIEAMFAAFSDVFAGEEPRLSIEDMQAAQVGYQEKQQAKYQAVIDKNKTDGDAFLAENGKKSGVITTESGLQYEVLREGKGAKPTPTDTIKVHYTGTLIDGTKFDSSYDRGAPADFGVSGVIPGFGEGLQLMKEGAKYRFTIPASIAYGEQGPASIGPNQTLIFEVELIEIVTQSATKKVSE